MVFLHIPVGKNVLFPFCKNEWKLAYLYLSLLSFLPKSSFLLFLLLVLHYCYITFFSVSMSLSVFSCDFCILTCFHGHQC